MRKSVQERMPFFLIFVSSIFLIKGCGIKQPPVVPQQGPLPAVNDLRLTRGPQGIWLTWSMPETPPVDPFNLAGFIIHRSKTEAGGMVCQDCPILFERLTRVPMETRNDPTTGALVFVFEDRPAAGFNYIYKVTLLDKEGREGPDSNRVEVSF